MSLVIVAAILLAFAFGREWILAKHSGWTRLSQKYRCRVPLKGKWRACWWAQFTVPRAKRTIVVNVGHMTRWPFRLDIPSYWIGASSEGLYLKRNIWNLLHPRLLIPWHNIHTASEITYKELLRNVSPAGFLVSLPVALHPFVAAAQGVGGPLLELTLGEPDFPLAIVAQLSAFREALPFLGAKLGPPKPRGYGMDRIFIQGDG